MTTNDLYADVWKVGVAVVFAAGVFGVVYIVNENTKEVAVWITSNILSLDRELLANLSAGISHSEEVTIETANQETDALGQIIFHATNRSIYEEVASTRLLEKKIVELQDGQDALEEELLISKSMLASLTQKLTKEGVTIKRRPTGTPQSYIHESDKTLKNLSNPQLDEWQHTCFTERKTNTTLCYTAV